MNWLISWTDHTTGKIIGIDFNGSIDPAFYTKVSAVTDENHYYLSIGDVTVDDIAYSNVVLVFTFSSQTWRIRTYAEQIMRFSPYIGSDGSYKIMCGKTYLIKWETYAL